MAIEFLGQTVAPITRCQTGWYSFDLAFSGKNGQTGLPVKAICQISGPSGSGKSTLAESLSGKVAAMLGGNIAFADIEEHFDPDLIGPILEHNGFSGNLYVAKGDLDAKKLEDLIEKMREEEYVAGIVDSIGAISPVAEAQGNLEDANMGRRAKLTAVLSRQIVHAFRMKSKPSVLFIISHQHDVIGSHGFTTSGGKVKDYLSTTHMRISVKEQYEGQGYWIAGKVEKNSFGYSKRPFYLFVVGGLGIHRGLSAVKDCLVAGIAKESKTIKLGDKSYGYFKRMIDNYQDDELFKPFIDALNGGKVEIGDGDDE